uniref:Homing endonuclease LAGLIDADG domain-containing protein n=1 Tax=Trebouxia angustilobata TaxID=664442 RepID=C7AZ01_9CHLO|nr:hypothetical protein [Trebouxia angustilobata]
MEKNSKLTLLQKEVLFGVILGDAHLETQNNRITYRVKFEQSIKHKAYIEHLYDVFKNYVKTSPQLKLVTYKNSQTNGQKQSINIRFATISSSTFTFFGKQFYKDKKKVIPKLIHRWLTPRALAYWYMDDGSMKSTQSKGVLLNTQAFSHSEVQLLCNVLTEKFNLYCWPRKQKKNTYQIYISGKTYETLRNCIYPFIIPDMQYKFPLPRKIR